MARRTRSDDQVFLGSLTQVGVHALSACHSCSSTKVTRIGMQLTDGTPVDFISCHVCETRSWTADGAPLKVDEVLLRARKPR